MKRIIRLFTIIGLFAFALSSTLMAQPLPGGGISVGHPTGDPLNGPLGAPIDDSVLLLVLLALAYAAKKYYDIRKLRKAA